MITRKPIFVQARYYEVFRNKMSKQKAIEYRIKCCQKAIDNAEKYLAKGENIEGSGFLHLDDWVGHSGHPKWVKNVLIPRLKKRIAAAEKTIEKISQKEKEKNEQTSILPTMPDEEGQQGWKLFDTNELHP